MRLRRPNMHAISAASNKRRSPALMSGVNHQHSPVSASSWPIDTCCKLCYAVRSYVYPSGDIVSSQIMAGGWEPGKVNEVRQASRLARHLRMQLYTC